MHTRPRIHIRREREKRTDNSPATVQPPSVARMKNFESTEHPVDIPLVVGSISTSADVSADKPADERPHTSLWVILAYAAPSMPSVIPHGKTSGGNGMLNK